MKQVDVAILEVGLGGKFDATNVVCVFICLMLTQWILKIIIQCGSGWWPSCMLWFAWLINWCVDYFVGHLSKFK